MDPFQYLIFSGDTIRKIKSVTADEHMLESIVDPLIIFFKNHAPGIGRIMLQISCVTAAEKFSNTIGTKQTPGILHIIKIIGSNAAGNRIDDVCQLFSGLFEDGNIVEYTLQKGMTAVFAYFPGVNIDPDDVSVAMLFAEFKACRFSGFQYLAYLPNDHSGIFLIDKISSILFYEQVIFIAAIAGKSGYAVRIVNRFKDVGNFIDCDAAGNSVNDILGI